MSGTKGYRASRHRELELWLWGACEATFAEFGESVGATRCIRTSSSTVTMWQASATTTFAATDRQDPDVVAAIALGFDVVRRDAIGDSKRASLGSDVFVLCEHHAPGGQSRRQIGVLLRVGRTLFIYLLSSARAGNLWAATADREGNAATEIISAVVRVMTDFGRRKDPSYRAHLHAREHERIVRDERHGADLKRTLETCRAIAHIPNTLDLGRRADAQTFSFGSMMAASNAISVISGTNRAEIVIQANGGFYEDVKLAPFTHGPSVLRETDLRSGVVVRSVDIHRLAVVDDVDDATRKLRILVDCILGSAAGSPDGRCDWQRVGAAMAELGLQSRLPKYRKRGLTVGDTDPAGWAAAAKSLFQGRWIEGWQTGAFAKLVRQKIPLELDGLDLNLVVADDGGTFVKCRVAMPLPPGGWGVSDEEWDRVKALRYPADRKPRVHTGDVLPMAGSAAWTSEGTTARVMSRSDRYVLFTGPVRADGVAWDKWCRTARHVATIRPSEWHQDIARAAEAALERLTDEVLPLWFEAAGPSRAAVRPGNQRPSPELPTRLEAAEARADSALDTYNERRAANKAGGGSPDLKDQMERAHRAVERAEQAVQELRNELRTREVRVVPAEPTVCDGAASTATAELAVAALSLCRVAAPAWLQQACSMILRDMQVEPVSEALPGGRRQLSWRCTLVLAVRTADGAQRQVGLPLAGTVFDRSNRMSGAATSAGPGSGPEKWAWQFFYCGQEMREIGADSGGIDGTGKKNSYLYKGLASWAGAVIPERTFVNAILDCPVPETRRVIWWSVVGDDAAVRRLDEGYVRHVSATYRAPARLQTWGWCHDSHDLARTVADYLLQAGGSAPLVQMAADLGVSCEALLALTRVNGKVRAGEVKVRARAAVSPFLRNWARSTRWMAAEEKRLALRECPHADCPERLRGGTPFASHILATPETVAGYGVLCPSCRRLPAPELSDVRFPVGYLRPWSGRYGVRASVRQRQRIGTRLDPSRADVGPGEPLPDTGSRPRPETTVNRPGSHPTKASKHTQLGGRLVLLLGLDEARSEELRRLVEARGGRVAAKLRATVACVVAPASGLVGTEARVIRAMELGIPVLEPAEFRSQLQQGWRPEPR